MPATVHVEGLRELNRAFAQVSRDVKRDTRSQLARAAEPARVKAEELASANIRNIGSVWPRMKLGVTMRAVYIAPATRRTIGTPRSNLGGLLLKRAMLPGVDETSPEIEARLERWLDTVGINAGF